MTATAEGNFAGQVVERMGPNSCLIDAATGRTICPDDLPRLVAAYGASLRAAGLREGDRVLIGCSLTPASALAYLGAIYAGLVAVPVEDRAVRAAAAMLIETTAAKAVWTETGLRGRVTPHRPILYLQGDVTQGIPKTMAPAARAASDLAALVATSGSTGAPRFVMVSHGNLIANTEAIIRSQALVHNDRAMLVLPLSYCFGASVLHSHLYQGGGVVFDRRFMFPDKVLHAISKYACTTFAGVPTAYNILLRRSNIRSIKMPSLRRFLQAGGPLAPPRIAELRAAVPKPKVYVMYGQTEATARISCLEPERLDEKLGSVGRPLDNLTVRIVDEDGNTLPAGEMGEIWVKGPSITLGYLNEPEESLRVFYHGWLRTGDLGHLDADGYIWIDGRKGAFLKIRGVRVSFAEIEGKVAAIPGVYECAATAVPHPEAGEAVALYVVPDQEGGDVVDRVRRSLPVDWTCESIQIVAKIPKTTRGKIARTSLSA